MIHRERKHDERAVLIQRTRLTLTHHIYTVTVSNAINFNTHCSSVELVPINQPRTHCNNERFTSFKSTAVISTLNEAGVVRPSRGTYPPYLSPFFLLVFLALSSPPFSFHFHPSSTTLHLSRLLLPSTIYIPLRFLLTRNK